MLFNAHSKLRMKHLNKIIKKPKGEKIMKTERMTNKRALEYVIENCDLPTEIMEKFEKMRDSASRKTSSGTKKPTATQIANETRKEKIMEVLAESIEPLTATEIMNHHDNRVADEEMKLNSNQRTSALLKQLIEEGKVVKEKTGNKTLFHAIVTEEI